MWCNIIVLHSFNLFADFILCYWLISCNFGPKAIPILIQILTTIDNAWVNSGCLQLFTKKYTDRWRQKFLYVIISLDWRERKRERCSHVLCAAHCFALMWSVCTWWSYVYTVSNWVLDSNRASNHDVKTSLGLEIREQRRKTDSYNFSSALGWHWVLFYWTSNTFIYYYTFIRLHCLWTFIKLTKQYNNWSLFNLFFWVLNVT